MPRREQDAVGELALPPEIQALLQEHRLAEPTAELLVVELVREVYFWEVDALIGFLLDVHDVLDEVLDVEEGSEVGVLPAHRQELLRLNYHHLMLRNQREEVARLARVGRLHCRDRLLRHQQHVVYLLVPHL